MGLPSFAIGLDIFLASGTHPYRVGARFGASLQAVKPLLQRVLHFGAGDDHHVFVTPRIDGGFDLGHELFFRNDADVEPLVPRPLGRHLIFDVNRRNAGALEFALPRGQRSRHCRNPSRRR